MNIRARCRDENENNVSPIYVNGEAIQTAETLKLPGVKVDSILNFSDHINTVCKKASQGIGVYL